MVLPKLPRSLLASLSGRLPDVAAPGVWTIGVGVATLLAARLTGSLWIAAAAGGMVAAIAVRQWVAVLAVLRSALAEAEQERGSMGQALRRSQKTEALGRLTVGVAHDFNNHLTVISSNVELIAQRLGADRQRLLRHTDAAMQGVRGAAILTGRLLSLSRQPAVEPEPADVDRLVLDLSELLQRMLGDRIGLEVRVSGAPWFAWADVHQMENALLSLVMKAGDQVPDGGVLSVDVSNVKLDTVFVAAHPAVVAGDYIQVGISGSTGAERWKPAEDLTTTDLYIARTFVGEAGGCLVRSEPAEGRLSLRLFLPRYIPPSVSGAEAARVSGSQTRILVVEDDAAIRAVCVETLRSQGYDVLDAPDAMQAFRLIADQGGIDLLFADLGLPGGVGGRALADAARNLDPAMRVLFTTGYDRVDLPGRPVPELLAKPFNPAQLIEKVRDVLANDRPVERSETVRG